MQKKNEFVRYYKENIYQDEDITLHQAGDVVCSQYSEIDYHKNPGYEICIIPYGKGIFKIGDVSYPVAGNQLFLTKQPQLHGGWPSREQPFRIQFICFSINENTMNKEWKWVLDELEQISTPVANDKLNISSLHNSLSREIISLDKYSQKLISSLVLNIAVDTVRNFYNTVEKPTNTVLSNKVMDYIKENLSNKLTLKDISEGLNYSVPYLSRYFKLQTGFTIMEYLNIARLESSKKYLSQTDDLISDIALKVGFGTVQHFSYGFKKLYGCSANEYRRKTHGVVK